MVAVLLCVPQSVCRGPGVGSLTAALVSRLHDERPGLDVHVVAGRVRDGKLSVSTRTSIRVSRRTASV